MQAPNHPEDREKKLKGLIAGERGRGFAEIMPAPQEYLLKLKSLVARTRKRRPQQRANNGHSSSS